MLAWAALAFGLAGAAPLPAEQEARVHRLAQSLRCPVCQNQTLAESNAPVALDLREQIQAQVAAGRSDDEVRAFMVQRFGDFVLYEPPRTPQTLLLWLGRAKSNGPRNCPDAKNTRPRQPAPTGSFT